MSQEKVIAKVKKLLALSESSNPNEALLAAKRARRLMDQHSLTKEDIESAGGSEFLESKSDFEYRQRNSWIINLQSAVAMLNDCVGVIEPSDGLIFHKFRGFTADAVVAKMTLDYLIEACGRCCKAANVSGRSEKNQFRLGFASAISRKVMTILDEREKSFVSTTGTNIIPIKINQIKQHFGDLKVFNQRVSREPTYSEIEAYLSGSIAGEQTSLDKQVDGEETAKVKLQEA
jgi:hypothetical protein